MTKNIAISMAAAALLAGAAACNSDTEYHTELDGSAMVRTFSLVENNKILADLDSVYFSIDLVSGDIFNADSLPMGTRINGIAANIVTDNASEITLRIPREGKPDSVVNYLEHSADTIDFSQGPVRVEVVSLSGATKKEYKVRINVHKVKSDSLCWGETAFAPLPAPASATAQRTVQQGGVAYTFSSGANGSHSVAATSDFAAWMPQEFTPGFDMDMNSIVATPDAFYALSSDGTLHKASDAAGPWSATYARFHSLYGAYGDMVVGCTETQANTPSTPYPSVNHVIPSAYAYGQYNGKQYCLPYECAPKLMFVNKTILDNEGLEVPDKDWTWDDLYSICEKVTKDTDGNGTVDQFGVIGYTWKEAFESEGINLFNRNGTECYFTDAGIGKALSFIEKLENINSGYNAGSKDFDLGNVVFQPMSFSDYRAYKPYPLSVKKYTGFEWGCIPMPAGPDGDNISTLDTLFIAINEKSRNKKAAWELVKALAYNTEIQSEIFNYSEGVSVLKDVTESEQTLGQMMDGNSLDLAILSNIVEEAVVVPRFGNYEEAVAQVEQAVTAIIEDGYNISMGQIIWNRKINKYLKNSK